MACLPNEVRIVILDLETSKQKVIKIKHPWKCATSQHLLAITTTNDGLHLFSTDCVLVRIVPKSTKASCAAFHTLNTNILAIGYKGGTVRFRDMDKQASVVSVKKHYDRISNIRFATYCRFFVPLTSIRHRLPRLTISFRLCLRSRF